MAPARPRVLTGLQLPELVQHLLEHDSSSSVLVICTSKDVFVEQLHATCLDSDINNTNDEPPTDTIDPEPKEPSNTEHHPLLKQPTLHQLATSRKVKLVFCPELVHLRAYLSTLAIPTAENNNNNIKPTTNLKIPLLTILSPIDIHRSTSSFSAQGLNRTFALAVEAAHATQTQLLMVECPSLGRPRDNAELSEDAGYDFEFEPGDTTTVPAPAPAVDDPWGEEVSILNVTTKSFGVGGRGWVGRTVTVRRVAERWCVFSPFRRGERFV